jgi:S-adenosylmethionine-diacylgycerolhomoserine-N-methlytransferase
MSRLDAWRDDLAILRGLLRGMPRGETHAGNLAAFYSTQAEGYDRFRERLLQGRQELIERLPLPHRARVVELGAGTGRNLDFFGSRLDDIGAFDLVDLCVPLLAYARRRADGHAQVRVIDADAAQFDPGQPVDCVYFSYSLTMVPPWRAAIANAWRMLRPGGVVGVVDFYVAEENPPHGLVRHSAATRGFWPRWFAHDGVKLDAGHLPTLRATFETVYLREGRARVPYLPLLHAPYYVFVGRKPIGETNP